jgi:hypothetical protein
MKKAKLWRKLHRGKAPVLLLSMMALAFIHRDKVSLVRNIFTMHCVLCSSWIWIDFHPPHLLRFFRCQPLFRHPSRDEASAVKSPIILHTPPSLGIVDSRALSLNLGGGNCKWLPPEYEVPEDLEFHKTIIAGFPSGDKRMIFIQMEGLTGWREFFYHSVALLVFLPSRRPLSPDMYIIARDLVYKAARDEWDFEFLGMTNHPFIKANYPHHEGIWGWGNVADQVVLMVRNIRKSMVECECARS